MTGMRSPHISLGTDIVDVVRIRKMIRNRRFLARIFSREEVQYCKNKKNAAQHFAVRFAAKEAVWKALGSAIKPKGIGHKEISVKRSPNGKPFVSLSSRLKKYQAHIALSLSHTKEYAIAVAVYQPK